MLNSVRISYLINPKGTAKANFARVDEQALFVVPNIGRDVILGRPSSQPTLTLPSLDELADDDELDADEELSTEDIDLQDDELVEEVSNDKNVEWEYQHARRRGSESSYRPQRPNQFYPIYIDEKNRTVVLAGNSIPKDQEPNFVPVDGLRPIWPIDQEGLHRCWRFVTESMQREIDAGNVFLGKYNSKRDTWTINMYGGPICQDSLRAKIR